MPGQRASETLRRQQILKAAHQVGLSQGIDGLTVRAVAARARLSHGLVLFHFKRKDQLVSALLDRVLGATFSLRIAEDVARMGGALDRLRGLLLQEVERLSGDPRQVRLFLEYWAFGTRRPAIRRKISLALGHYRAAFRGLAEEVLQVEGARFPGVTPERLAATAVTFINGCAVQAMIDLDQFDVGEYLTAVRGILGRLPMAA